MGIVDAALGAASGGVLGLIGGAVIKSICDWLSWLAGLGASAWALYRLTPRLWSVLLEIEEDRRNG